MGELERIEAILVETLSHSSLFPDRDLTFHVIINPHAGVFDKQHRLEAARESLETYAAGLVVRPVPGRSVSTEIYRTEFARHATDITRSIRRSGGPGVQVVVSCGGDGTHGEVLTAMLDGDPLNDVYIFRMPFGTGNDGPDAKTLPEALNVLLDRGEPGRTGHLVVQPTGMGEFYSFNIASIGLDAYVGFLTDRLKKLPVGDLYKILADLMTVFYDVIVGVDEMHIRVQDDHGRISEVSAKMLLCAFGVSGFRTYGGKKRILPGFDNVCAIERMPLLRKLKLKSLVYRGEHQGVDKIHFMTARRLQISYGRRVPIQLDGEPVWLEPENFPVTVEIYPPAIPTIR